jgi:hypothetical protein
MGGKEEKNGEMKQSGWGQGSCDLGAILIITKLIPYPVPALQSNKTASASLTHGYPQGITLLGDEMRNRTRWQIFLSAWSTSPPKSTWPTRDIALQI